MKNVVENKLLENNIFFPVYVFQLFNSSWALKNIEMLLVLLFFVISEHEMIYYFWVTVKMLKLDHFFINNNGSLISDWEYFVE